MGTDREDLGVRKGSCMECGRTNIDIVPLGNSGLCYDVESCMKLRKKNIDAKNGFMGMIDTKTMFTVGEGGKKEHVKRKKNNNIFDVGFDF